jgi:hypothetical protein
MSGVLLGCRRRTIAFTMTRKSVSLSVIILILGSLGCGGAKRATDNTQSTDTPKNYADTPTQPTSAPSPKTSIYRYLSGLENAYPNKELLTDLCIRKHGFHQDLPVQGIKAARDVRLPVAEEWTEARSMKTTKHRSVTVQPQEVGGNIMKSEEVREPYTVTEVKSIAKRISGICIGSEYIVE